MADEVKFSKDMSAEEYEAAVRLCFDACDANTDGVLELSEYK